MDEEFSVMDSASDLLQDLGLNASTGLVYKDADEKIVAVVVGCHGSPVALCASSDDLQVFGILRTLEERIQNHKRLAGCSSTQDSYVVVGEEYQFLVTLSL